MKSKKRTTYRDQLAETHTELQEHETKTREAVYFLRRGSFWIVLWAFIGAGQSAIQIRPWPLGVAIGLAVFGAGLLVWRLAWVILEWPISLYVGVMTARFFIASTADQPAWQKWGLGVLVGVFFFVGYWSFKSIRQTMDEVKSSAAHDITRLQSRLVQNREAYARRTTKSQRHRNKSGSADFTENEWMDLCFHYDYTCLRCGRREPEIMLTPDHVVPLARGGTNLISNIQPLCLHCNTSKNARTVDYREGK